MNFNGKSPTVIFVKTSKMINSKYAYKMKWFEQGSTHNNFGIMKCTVGYWFDGK